MINVTQSSSVKQSLIHVKQQKLLRPWLLDGLAQKFGILIVYLLALKRQFFVFHRKVLRSLAVLLLQRTHVDKRLYVVRHQLVVSLHRLLSVRTAEIDLVCGVYFRTCTGLAFRVFDPDVFC